MQKFYPVKAVPGREDSSIVQLRQRLQNLGLSSFVGRIIAPTREIKETTADGSEKIRIERQMPGYLLIECRMNSELWGAIIGTPGIGKVSASEMPQALSMSEVARLMGDEVKDDSRHAAAQALRDAGYEQGDVVKITDGPFAGYDGDVEEILHDGARLRVQISLFERQTSVEIDAGEVRLVHRQAA